MKIKDFSQDPTVKQIIEDLARTGLEKTNLYVYSITDLPFLRYEATAVVNWALNRPERLSYCLSKMAIELRKFLGLRFCPTRSGLDSASFFLAQWLSENSMRLLLALSPGVINEVHHG